MDTEQFAEIMAGLQSIKTDQQNFRKELLGNGQPGRIQIIESRIKDAETKQQQLDVRTASIIWKLGTLSAGAGTALTLVVQWLVRKVFHF